MDTAVKLSSSETIQSIDVYEIKKETCNFETP